MPLERRHRIAVTARPGRKKDRRAFANDGGVTVLSVTAGCRERSHADRR
jgi:hypothetical protein